MEEETISLIYLFLSEKDKSLAEIFKRQFSPDLSKVKDLPSLIEIVEGFVKKKKKESSKSNYKPIALNSAQITSMIQNTKTDSSDFLERIVIKRNDEKSCDDDTTEEEEDQFSVSSNSSFEIVTSAAKRRRTNVGTQNIYKKKSNKNA